MSFDLVSLGLVCADVMVKPVDSLPDRGTLGLVPQLEMHLGGLAAVTAIAFRRLGGKSAFVGSIGNDGFGDYLYQHLAKNGVNLDGVKRSETEGTPATVVLLSGEGERTFLHHAGTAKTFSEDDVDFAFLWRGKMVHWGGPAVTPGLDGEPIGRIFKRAKEAGLKTSFDTCYDGSGVWFPRIEHALPYTDIVMSSLEEARQYTGKEDPDAIADFYLSFGPQIALIKLGSEGMFVKDANQTFKIPAHRVTPVDTTGAGDASCGGFLFGYLQGWDMERCAKLANAVGALTVQAMGGSNGIANPEQAFALMDKAE